MKVEAKTKKKPAAPVVKTMGIKKKTPTAPAGVAAKKKEAVASPPKKVVAKKAKTAAVDPSAKKVGSKKKAATPSGDTVKEKEVVAKKAKAATVAPAGKKGAAAVASEEKVKKAKRRAVAASGEKIEEEKAGTETKKEEEAKDSGVAQEKKKKTRRKRKTNKPKANDKESESPAKKQKVAGPLEMKLEGKQYELFCKRNEEVLVRTLYVVMDNFKLSYIASPPPIFKSAQFVKICGTKGLIHLEYKSKEEAEKMKDVLKKNRLIKEVRLATEKVDGKKESTSINVHPLKLYVTNIPRDVTRVVLKKKFPTARGLIIKRKKGYVHVIYKTQEEAAKVFEEAENIQINDVKLTVLYVRSKRRIKATKKKQGPKQENKEGSPVKKAKQEEKEGTPVKKAKKEKKEGSADKKAKKEDTKETPGENAKLEEGASDKKKKNRRKRKVAAK